MNRTKIEWCDFTWNPVTGCLHNCPYCYGRKIAKRFPNLFPNGYEPTFHPERLNEPYNSVPKNFRSKNPNLPQGSAMIFTVSMGDLFGDWVPAEWIEAVIKVAEDNPQHVFQFLTKNPIKYYEFKFPKNCWLGTTVTGLDMDSYRIFDLIDNTDDKNIRFVSFEPYLKRVDLNAFRHKLQIDWIIIGAQTNPWVPPIASWVYDLINLAKQNLIPIFLKDNLRWPEKIQEWPEVRD